MRFWRYFVFNSAGCIAWAGLFVLVGYAAGESWRIVEKWIGRAGLFMLLLPIVVIAIVVIVRRRSGQEDEEVEPEP